MHLQRNEIFIVIFTLILTLICFSQAAFADTPAKYNPDKPEILIDKFLYAQTAVLIEQHSGQVLYNMNASKRMQPASTTKIMTLLLALENCNLKDVIIVGDEITKIPGDSTKVPLIIGEKITLEELLYGLIIQSGNDAAMTIAKHVSGSIDKFVVLMNERAKELGCTDTSFANPHGYEDKTHYSTAMDMALIARAGMANEDFKEIVSKPSFTIKANNKREKTKTIKTKNQFIGRDKGMENQYEYGTGIKTGYFSAAKHTFVGSATKDGMDLIAVVLKTTQQGKWIDAKRLMEYGFAKCTPYSFTELYNGGSLDFTVDVAQGANSTVGAELDPNAQGFNLAGTANNVNRVKEDFEKYCKFTPEQNIVAPVQKGDTIGTLTFTPVGGLPVNYPMVATASVAQITPIGVDTADGKARSTDGKSVISLLTDSTIAAQGVLNVGETLVDNASSDPSNVLMTVLILIIVAAVGACIILLILRSIRIKNIKRRRIAIRKTMIYGRVNAPTYQPSDSSMQN